MLDAKMKLAALKQSFSLSQPLIFVSETLGQTIFLWTF